MDDIRKAQLDTEFNIAIQTDDKDLMKSWLDNAMNTLENPDAYLIEKAKYIRREGTAGNYKYIYSEKKSTKHGDGAKLQQEQSAPKEEKTEGETSKPKKINAIHNGMHGTLSNIDHVKQTAEFSKFGTHVPYKVNLKDVQTAKPE